MKYSNLVSVIIPFNKRLTDEKINHCLQTILDQNHQEIEVIVIDNNPEKNSYKLTRKTFYDLKYISQDYGHICNAYNMGVELAQGKFLAFIDSQNLWLPDKLTIQMAAFESYPKLDGVFGYIYQQIISQVPEDLEHLSLEASLQSKNIPGYIPSTMLIKRQAWKKVGQFSRNFLTWYQRAINLQLVMMMLPVIVAKRQIELSRADRDSDRAITEYTQLLNPTMKGSNLEI
jgi:glycosyltransferase involved in cell wall biosynthesis